MGIDNGINFEDKDAIVFEGKDAEYFKIQTEAFFKRWPTTKDVQQEICPACESKEEFCDDLISGRIKVTYEGETGGRWICPGMMKAFSSSN